MLQQGEWARVWPAVKRAVIPRLRRGVWYPVVENDKSSKRVVLEVGKQRLPIARHLVEFRFDPPRRFTVVVRPAREPNPTAGTARDLGIRYAVCPVEGARIQIVGRPDTMECPACGHQGVVAWWEAVI